MSSKANELSLGEHIFFEGKVRKIIEKQHVKPGKGGAYLQMTLRSLDGIKTEKRFSPSDVIEIVRVEKKKYSFSYLDRGSFVLLDPETYEEIEVGNSNISNENAEIIKKFAKEGDILDVELANNIPFNIIFPNFIVVEIESADAVVKGQTAASSFKNAVINDGVQILVPTYINSGDKIKINLYGDKGIEFVERVMN